MARWLIYGATGYTGRLIVRDALARGHRPVLAGRSSEVAALAAQHNCHHRVFGLDVPDLAAELRGVTGVCHVAGPFTATSAPMMAACLAAGVHYIDLATELEVFERAAGHHDEAVRRGVLLMPGSGFNVAVTDAVAVALHESLPDADHLTLAVDFGETRHSYGGTVMGIEALAAGVRVREHDQIRRIPSGSRQRLIPLAAGARRMATLPFPFGDPITARHSTGIPNIEIYLPASHAGAAGYRIAGLLRHLIATGVGQRALKRMAHLMFAAPDAPEARARVRTVVWGEVRNPAGETAALELTTRHSYEVTSEVAVRAMEAISEAPAGGGFRTPGSLLDGRRFLDTLTGIVINPITRRGPTADAGPGTGTDARPGARKGAGP